VAAATGVANKLVARAGPRPLAVAGLATAAAGMLGLGHAPAAADYWTQVLPGMVFVGLGAGLSFVSITTAALGAVDDAAAGVASGLLSTTVQIGGALGVTVLAGVVVTQRAGALLATGSSPVAAQVGGLQLAFLIAAAIALTASLIALIGLRSYHAGQAPTISPSAEVLS
jgi:MFS family permease